MNTRTAPGNPSNLSPNRSASRVEEQLAFVERVCDLLIESRAMGGYSYLHFAEFVATTPAKSISRCSKHLLPLSEFIPEPSLVDLDIEISGAHQFVNPRTARPAALANQCSSPAAPDLNLGVRGIKPQIPASAQPRGSPT